MVRSARVLVVLMLLAACRPDFAVPTTIDHPGATTTLETPVATTTPVPVTPPPVLQLDVQLCNAEREGLLCEVYDLVDEHYVDEVPDATLADAAAAAVDALDETTGDTPVCLVPSQEFAIVCEALADEGVSTAVGEVAAVVGLLEALDPNSLYLSPEALALIAEDQSGAVEGIGALVSAEDLSAEDPEASVCSVISETCRLVVISTFANSPARLAGVEAGDVLVAVDEQPIEGWNVDEVTAAVRGPAGTSVALRVDRNGAIVDLTIVRAALTIPVVETGQIDDVGYLRLNQFTETSDRQVHEAIEGLLADGAERLVLDLRDNPGGALHATVEIASEFMSEGIVVRTESPSEDLTYRVDDGGLLTDGTPVVVLVNEGSASASEVLAAALQEHDRALVIGRPTFGKNTVQQRYGLSDGGALKLTVARWVTEAGSDFGETGVLPDIAADLDQDLTVDELVAEVSRLSGW